MKALKLFNIFSSLSPESPLVTIRMVELLDSSEYAITTWPCASLLSIFIACNPTQFRGKRVMEIGAGTALPSMVCAKLGAARVCASDRAEENDLLSHMQDMFVLNNVQETCQTLPLNWDDVETLESEASNGIDVLLGADVFYCDEDFSTLCGLLSRVIDHNPHCVCYITYQERNTRRTIQPLLTYFQLTAEVVTKDSFLHPAHDRGFCEVRQLTSEADEDAVSELLPVTSFDHMYVLKIWRPEHSLS